METITVFEHDANVNFINNIHPDQAVSSQGTHLAINFERRRKGKHIKNSLLLFWEFEKEFFNLI